MTLVGSLRLYATPEPVAPRGLTSPASSMSTTPSKGDCRVEGRIPFISVGDGESGEWPQMVSMTKEAQEFIAQIEGPICVLVCMGYQGTDKVSAEVGVWLICFCLSLYGFWCARACDVSGSLVV